MADDRSRDKSDREANVKPDSTSTHPGAPTSVEHTEPEKHFESAGQHSKQRRALEENVKGDAGQAQPHPEQVAGQHATGSFTGTAEEPEDPWK
ncbi:MAG: hypothetical protein ACR2JE_08210 [Acidobacteriaceae bacterium]